MVGSMVGAVISRQYFMLTVCI